MSKDEDRAEPVAEPPASEPGTPPGGVARDSAAADAAAPGDARDADAAEAGVDGTAAESLSGRQRLLAAIWPPRLNRAQLLVAVLLFSLGLGLAIQVRSTSTSDSQLRGARQEDLVRILDEVDARQQRLQSERQQLQQSLTTLQNSSQQAKEAQIQTLTKEQQLGVLAGTVGATGPGIELTITDPAGKVQADMLLNTLEELRAAGAEAVQINDVRVVANTWFADAGTGMVTVGGTQVSQPYRFTVIGNSHDLDTALNIPGGVVQTVDKDQATATVTEKSSVAVTALIPLTSTDYAHSAQP
ncbi:DUF881 domain-containing protein [Streptacidiphilus sp. EB129]|uniref:DUF881 domain-containing protein n=1 Tax=Streptacidiphilus sp. EB129 TaxID=3156262 RepID=UPI003515F02C